MENETSAQIYSELHMQAYQINFTKMLIILESHALNKILILRSYNVCCMYIKRFSEYEYTLTKQMNNFRLYFPFNYFKAKY